MDHEISRTVSSIIPFLFAAVVVLAVFYFRHAQRREAQKTIRMAIEKGITLDPVVIEKLMPPPRLHSAHRLQTSGIILLFLGVGLTLLHLIVIGPELRSGPLNGAVIIGFIGIGMLVASRFTRRDETTLAPRD